MTTLFSKSYENLIENGLISYLYGCHGEANVAAEPTMAFGSHRSGLVARIRKDPCKAELTREEFIKIVTWVDANAPFYGTHEGKKNMKWRDEPDFRPAPLCDIHAGEGRRTRNHALQANAVRPRRFTPQTSR